MYQSLIYYYYFLLLLLLDKARDTCSSVLVLKET